jgi:pyruvate dehydrogenase E2 component (dihydrolipoamide acetyltransferase)
MAEELFIPKLGQTVEEVTLLNWLVKDGDRVKQGQEVLEVETDKAVFNVEAVDSGFIHIGPFKAGQVVPILEVVAIIGEQDEIFPTLNTRSAKNESSSLNQSRSSAPIPQNIGLPSNRLTNHKLFSSPRARKLAKDKGVDLRAVLATGGAGIRVRENDVFAYLSSSPKASPIAKKIADDAGVDLKSISASGYHGEITKSDVEQAIALRSKSVFLSEAQKPSLDLPKMEIADSLPLKGVRGVIADRMGASSRTTAHVTLFMDVDATDFVAFRENLKSIHQSEWGFAPGYNELLIKICSLALLHFPYLNSRLNGEIIEHLTKINIGIAVDIDKGLYVPVIQNAGQKNLRSIGSELRLLIEKVRNGTISPDDLTGGTFTISNLGMYDVDGFTPVINLPEAAILGVGKIAPKPVVRNDQIVVREMLTLSLTFDHRLIDGAPAAKFLQFIKELIESPIKADLT